MVTRSLSTKLCTLSVAAAVGLVGCGDNVRGEDADAELDTRPATYEFESKFSPGESAIAYNGQVFRQLLIEAYKAELGSWTDQIDGDGVVRSQSVWLEELNFFFRFDSATSLDQPIGLELGLPAVQMTWGDLSSGANLIAKIAGEDDTTDHQDWDGDGLPEGVSGGLLGWDEGPASSPVELMDHWMGIMAQQAEERAAAVPLDPFGNDIADVFITPQGQDLRQISQKFLTGAITFSQGTDDYLDSGTAGKGLESSNLQDEDNPYSTLGHTWDEGFGYFGGARVFSTESKENQSEPFIDADGNGFLDLKTEHNTGMSKNAAKRDLDSQLGAKTDFSSQIIEALITGRYIIWTNAGQELSAAQKAELEAQRDIVVDGWGDVFAATTIHYINEVITAQSAITDANATYDFAEHAKVWGELKGFALGLQFNPRSKLTSPEFSMVHALIGDAPVVTDVAVDLETYRTQLVMARDLLRDAHGFSQANAEGW